MTKRSGFTLVELLVAIAIFAVLSALGWKVFDYLIKIKERNTQHEQRLGQLQEAYQQVLRDTVRIVHNYCQCCGAGSTRSHVAKWSVNL